MSLQHKYMSLAHNESFRVSKWWKKVEGKKICIKCVNYIKVHTATRWTIRHSLMLHWFADLMNITEEVTIHRPNVLTLLSSAFIRGDLNAAKRSPFI